MAKLFSKTRNYGILLLTLVIAIAGVGGTINLVSADPCIAQLSYPILPTIYTFNSNIQVIVPVSATCTAMGSSLTAVGDAYDMSINTDLGSVNAIMNAVNGGTFSGQLIFNLAPSSLDHSVQVSVSIYNGGPYSPGQYGSLLTTVSETVQVTPANYQNPPTGNYLVQQPPLYNNAPYYPIAIQQQTTVTAYAPQQVIRSPFFFRGQFFNRQNNWLIGLVVVLITASVIVAVAFAIFAARNRQPQAPWPPPPPDQSRRRY